MKRSKSAGSPEYGRENVETRVVGGETGQCGEHEGELVGLDLGKVQKVVEELGDVAPRDELDEDFRRASVEIGSDGAEGTMLRMRSLRAA